MPRQSLKQRADGRYTVKYHGKFFYGSTQSEAIAKRDEYRRQVEQGLREEAIGATFQDYASRWIHTYKTGVTDRTFNSYAAIINRASDHLGIIRMTDITPMMIQGLYNTLIGKGAHSIHDFTMIIRSIFRSAVSDGVIPRDPCAGIRIPAGPSGTHRALTGHEIELIHASVGHHDMALAAMVMLYAGLRRGEAIALDVDRDVDFVQNRIYVRGAVRFEHNQPVITTTKTENGIRSVPLLPVLADVLRDRHGLILTCEKGTEMSEASFRRKWSSYLTYLTELENGASRRWYGKTKEQKGKLLPAFVEISIRPHDLRHTFATMLYESGVDLKSASRWMGHADETMIMKIYAHLRAEQESSSEKKLMEYTSSQNGSHMMNGDIHVVAPQHNNKIG